MLCLAPAPPSAVQPSNETPPSSQGYTLMHTAACNNNIAFIKRCWGERLLSPQLVNATDQAGNTPLHLAVVKGHEDMVPWDLRFSMTNAFLHVSVCGNMSVCKYKTLLRITTWHPHQS